MLFGRCPKAMPIILLAGEKLKNDFRNRCYLSKPCLRCGVAKVSEVFGRDASGNTQLEMNKIENIT